MKKISLIAAAALAVSAAGLPAFADEKVQSDPFVSSQGMGAMGGMATGMAVVGGIAVLTAIASTDDTD